MKTANVKWGRGKREATGKKVNARDEFVRPTWIDLSFPGNGARNSSATATKFLPWQRQKFFLLLLKQQRQKLTR